MKQPKQDPDGRLSTRVIKRFRVGDPGVTLMGHKPLIKISWNRSRGNAGMRIEVGDVVYVGPDGKLYRM